MPDLFQKYTFGLLLTLLALLASSISIAQAKSGTFSSQTLTFADADNATANLSVTVGGATPLLPPTTTRIRLQFLSDDVNSPLPPSVVTNVTFQLSNGIDPLPLSFTIADTGLDNSAKFPNKRIQFNVRDASKLLYDVEITHLTLIGAGTTETWTLAIAGLPPSGGSPVLRIIASTEQGSFSSLNPTGAQQCPTGQICQVKDTCSIAGQSCQGPCPNICPFGQSCQGPCPLCPPSFPWWKYVKLLYEIPFPIPNPPPPCLSCPKPWDRPIRDGFDRAMVSLNPIVQGELLGPGKAGQIRLDIKGGEPVGELVDAGSGTYFQMIEFRKGTSPKISAIAAGVNSNEITVAEKTIQTMPEPRNYLLDLLLLAAASLVGWFIGRNFGANRGLSRR